MKALLSVYDKTGIGEFAGTLAACGFELVSTGGTHRALSQDAGLAVVQVSDLTGFPEILDGRVKTLHPAVHGGILARRDLSAHTAELDDHGIDAIDLVAVNLYPFTQTISRPDVTLEDALENIDIGGPTMVRAGAKNYPHVIVVVDPADYGWVAERLSASGGSGSPLERVSPDERRGLARKAFQHVATYDSAIANYLGDGDFLSAQELTVGFQRLSELRYGENPHQQAGLYVDSSGSGGVARAEQLHGKQLSFNNILDADAAWRVVLDFEEPAAAVIKHTNPCGLAVHDDQPTAYSRAYEGDTVSAYGGIVGFNRTVTASTAEAMRGVFYEIVVAPGYEPEALDVLRKRKNLRVLAASRPEGGLLDMDLRRIWGGALIQTADSGREDAASWRVATERRPSEAQMEDLAFAWKAAKHIKSNAIAVARERALLGIGAGQPNRVNSVGLALTTAGDRSEGSVLASDAFFPFADSIEKAAASGVAAVIQPGGSIRDGEVVEAADRLGLAMVLTGTRHFKH